MLATGSLMSRHSVFWKTLAAFVLFASLLSCFLGSLVFFAAERLGVFLVQEQVAPVMATLIEAEKQHRNLDDDRHTGELAEAVNGLFLVGREIPDEIRSLGLGLHFENGRFVYLVNDAGILYALSGSSRAFEFFLGDLSGLLILGSILGLAFSALTACFLSRQLSQPLVELARIIQRAIPGECSIPKELAERKDETGVLASAMLDFQKKAREYYQREASFAGDLSHELRTPLAILGGSLENLQVEMGNASPAEQAQLLRMERTLGLMNVSVRSILSLARKNCADAEEIDLDALLEAEFERLKDLGICENAFISLRKRGCAKAFGQRDLAATALGNILANACKFSVDNRVHIRLVRRFISISNSSDACPKNSGGTGLGLSIARRCCEKMGWKLRIKAQDGRMSVRISYPAELGSAFAKGEKKT